MISESSYLVHLFRSLTTPPNRSGKTIFAATQIEPYKNFKLGKDAEGRPSLLIQSDPDLDLSSPPIRLQHLYIAYNLECEIFREEEVW